MRVRRNERGETEAFCATGNHWVLATTENLYRSTAANQGNASTSYGFANGYSDRGTTNQWRPRCRRCESLRQRSSSTNRSSRRSRTGRAFGVELELTGPSAQLILGALQQAGISVTHVGAYRSSNGARWELKRDGSVRGHGLELVSPKLYGEAGLEELRTVMYALQSVGATVDASCGTHVHVDFRGLDLAAAKRQLLSVLLNQDHMLAMVAPSRRGNSYNPSWTASQIDNLRSLSGTLNNAYGPRGTVNVGAFGRHGSVEFRSHGGTTNFAKLSAWVRFLMAALGSEAEVAYDSPAAWLDALGTAAADRAQLLRFVQAAEVLELSEYEAQREAVSV